MVTSTEIALKIHKNKRYCSHPFICELIGEEKKFGKIIVTFYKESDLTLDGKMITNIIKWNIYIYDKGKILEIIESALENFSKIIKDHTNLMYI